MSVHPPRENVQATLDLLRQLVDEETAQTNDAGVRFGYFISPKGSLAAFLVGTYNLNSVGAVADHLRVLSEGGYIDPKLLERSKKENTPRWVMLDVDFQYRLQASETRSLYGEVGVNETLELLRSIADLETMVEDGGSRRIACITLHDTRSLSHYLMLTSLSRFSKVTLDAHLRILRQAGFLAPAQNSESDSLVRYWVVLEEDSARDD